MDESNDPKPHPHVTDVHAAHEVAPDATGHHPSENGRTELSIWFFCGILMLAYGLVLIVQGILEIHHPPATVLANLQPTLWWGAFLGVFGLFYTVRFRPR